MEGYDPDLLLTKMEIECPICHMLPCRAYECGKCSTIFCEACIKKWLSTKAECTNRCSGSYIRESLGVQRIIKGMYIKCGECSLICKIDEYDKHINLQQCTQGKCCNDACTTFLPQMQNNYLTRINGRSEIACSESCQYVALLSEEMQELRNWNGVLYMRILIKAQSLINEIYKKKNEEYNTLNANFLQSLTNIPEIVPDSNITNNSNILEQSNDYLQRGYKYEEDDLSPYVPPKELDSESQFKVFDLLQILSETESSMDMRKQHIKQYNEESKLKEKDLEHHSNKASQLYENEENKYIQKHDEQLFEFYVYKYINTHPELKEMIEIGDRFDYNSYPVIQPSTGELELQEFVQLEETNEIYIGFWNREKKMAEGRGFSYMKGRRVMEGYYLDNKLSGMGLVKHLDGTRYLGEFRANKLHGWGTLYGFAGEKVHEGEFRNGSYIFYSDKSYSSASSDENNRLL